MNTVIFLTFMNKCMRISEALLVVLFGTNGISNAGIIAGGEVLYRL